MKASPSYEVVVLRRNDFTIDGRVERQAESLAERGLRVLVLTLGGNRHPRTERREGYDLERLPIDQELGLGEMVFGSAATGGRLRRRIGTLLGTAAYYEEAARRVLSHGPVVVHCHDLDTLLPGVLAASACGAKVIYDSAELWTERNSGLSGLRHKVDHVRYGMMEQRLAPRADAVITVSEGIAVEIATRYGIGLPTVIRNVPRVPEDDLRFPLREQVEGEGPILLHLGIVDANRGIEQVVQALPDLPEARLVLLGTARPPVLESLQALAREQGVAERVIHLPPVDREEIMGWAAEADVGLCTFLPTCLSHVLAMPNKLFEYAFAGVPIVASDLPQMGPYVRDNELGTVCDPSDPSDVARAIRLVLSGEVRRRTPEEVRAFCQAQGWEREFEKLWGIYCRLI